MGGDPECILWRLETRASPAGYDRDQNAERVERASERRLRNGTTGYRRKKNAILRAAAGGGGEISQGSA